MIIQVVCRDCGFQYDLPVEVEDWEDWRDGLSVQNAFPYLNASERELLISRTCGPCWDDLFKFDMEDEDASR